MPDTLRKEKIMKRLSDVFNQSQASVLAEVIVEAYDDLVKTSDFNELKGIVKELSVRTGELAEAQKRLAEAQKRTEIEIQKLVKGLSETRGELGGLSRTFSYAFENEAFRFLPKVLKEKYGIELKEKFIRAEIGGREINMFGRAVKDGRDVFILGEFKTRLDEKKRRGKEDVFKDLDEKLLAIRMEYGGVETIRVLVTHFATKGFLKEAEEQGVIVVQSFEW